MKLVLICLLISTLAIWDVDGLTCLPCTRVDCQPVQTCPWGVGKDACGCCDVCLKGSGEPCGGPWKVEGNCGDGLYCFKDETKYPPSVLFQVKGVCQPEG